VKGSSDCGSTSVRGPARSTQNNLLSSKIPSFSIISDVKKSALILEADEFRFNLRRFRKGISR
jgi:hypothetical protein